MTLRDQCASRKTVLYETMHRSETADIRRNIYFLSTAPTARVSSPLFGKRYEARSDPATTVCVHPSYHRFQLHSKIWVNQPTGRYAYIFHT